MLVIFCRLSTAPRDPPSHNTGPQCALDKAFNKGSPQKKRAATERLRAVSLSDHRVFRGMAGHTTQTRSTDSRVVDGSSELNLVGKVLRFFARSMV
jgi:hypothetical protein